VSISLVSQQLATVGDSNCKAYGVTGAGDIDDSDDSDDGDIDEDELGEDDEAADESNDGNGRINIVAWEQISVWMEGLKLDTNDGGITYVRLRNGDLWFYPPVPGAAMMKNMELGGAVFCRLRLFVWCPRGG
jgi:hypothetical protein